MASAFAIGFAETVTAWIALRTFHSHGARGRLVRPVRISPSGDPWRIGTGGSRIGEDGGSAIDLRAGDR